MENIPIETGPLGNLVQPAQAIDPVQRTKGANPKNTALILVNRSDQVSCDIATLLGERLNLGIGQRKSLNTPRVERSPHVAIPILHNELQVVRTQTPVIIIFILV